MPLSIETKSNAIETTNTWFDSHRVLVVDDDIAYLKVTNYMLNKLGIYTDATTDGAEAIKSKHEGVKNVRSQRIDETGKIEKRVGRASGSN